MKAMLYIYSPVWGMGLKSRTRQQPMLFLSQREAMIKQRMRVIAVVNTLSSNLRNVWKLRRPISEHPGNKRYTKVNFQFAYLIDFYDGVED